MCHPEARRLPCYNVGMDPTKNLQLYRACSEAGSLSQVDAFEQLWARLYPRAVAMLRDRPDGAALAADCAQLALIKIHQSLGQCREPERFFAWAAQILRRVVIDELRRPSLRFAADLEAAGEVIAPEPPMEHALASAQLRERLERAIATGGLSDRSQRVVRGRYFADRSDEDLAAAERELGGAGVLPSHIQVTRAKNLAKLRADRDLREELRALLDG